MWFWIFMLICNSLIPLMMWGIGSWFEKKPPEGINGVIGYRTKRSMKSQEAWDFAQRYMGRLWKRIGSNMLVPSIVIMLFTHGMTEDGIGNVSLVLIHVQMIVLLVSIYPVEKALKQKFDENGKSKK
ncbi:MAG: SdpI family protein [Lachnospiraceae bacterium]|nr:SdpI family protein [Lachnospiraceae bacterium]